MMAPIDRAKYMDIDEIRQLRTVTEAWAITDLQHGRIQGVTTWMVVDLALQTGLRVSEMATLSIEHIDFKRAAITVTRTKKQRRRPETLAISKYLAKHLKEYISWADQKKGPLFVGKRGPLTRRGLQQIWLSATRRVGMDEMSIHSARHSMAVHLLKKTRNLRQVQKQLGHASPATTANMYADISFEDMQEGVNGLYDD